MKPLREIMDPLGIDLLIERYPWIRVGSVAVFGTGVGMSIGDEAGLPTALAVSLTIACGALGVASGVRLDSALRRQANK